MKTTKMSLVALLSSGLLFAESLGDINGALKVGTLGYGVDLSSPFNDSLAFRLNMNGFSMTRTDSQDGTDFEGTLDLFTVGALLDYYPTSTNFRLSTGIYYNGNGFSGNAKPSTGTTVNIDGNTYTLGEFGDIGSLSTDLTFGSSTAPYIGIGWGNDAHDKGWGFTFDLGAMYHGTPEAKLKVKDINPNLPTATVTQIENDVADEEQSINNDLADFKFYPVISLGVNYTF